MRLQKGKNPYLGLSVRMTDDQRDLLFQQVGQEERIARKAKTKVSFRRLTVPLRRGTEGCPYGQTRKTFAVTARTLTGIDVDSLADIAQPILQS